MAEKSSQDEPLKATELEPVRLSPATHGEGPCDVLHLSADGRRIFTTGADGRLAGSNATTEPPTREWAQKLLTGIGTMVTAAVSPDGNWLALAEETDVGFQVVVKALDEKGRVNPHGAQKVRSVGRFTLDVRHLSWHQSLPYLTMATDDGKVDVWCDFIRVPEGSKSKPKHQLCKLGHADGGARCASLDPLCEYVAAIFTSGQLVVFNFKDSLEVYRSKALTKSVIGKERLCIAWSPKGEFLAVPGEPSVRVFSRNNFEGPPKSLEGAHRFSTTLASWAPSGSILATSSFEAVALWQDEQLHRIFPFEAQPYSFAWSSSGLLAVGTEAGSLAFLKVCEPTHSNQEVLDQKAGAPSSEPAQSMEVSAPPSQEAADDVQAKSQEETSSILAHPSTQEASEPIVQQRFQPGATSLESRRRYLAWNENGTLKLVLPSPTPSSSSSSRRKGTALPTSGGHIEIEYSKERGRTSVRETKVPEGISMGSLGPGTCALAAAGTSTRPARLYVHLATAWQRHSFEQALPFDETVEALAIGRSFVAAFTSPYRFLRISTLSFIPLGVLGLAGDVVAMAAYEDLLLIVTEVPDRKFALEEPALEFALYGVLNKERLASGLLPLSPRSSLRWLGFSSEAQPLALDSKGVLRAMVLGGAGGNSALLSLSPGSWLPVAELPIRGSRLWPVRAEAGALYCAEIPKSSTEPRIGGVPRLLPIGYKLPFGPDCQEKVLRQGLLSAHVNFALCNNLLSAPTKRAAREAPALRRAGSGGVNSPTADSTQVLKLFEKLLKSGDLEQALDTAVHFFASCNDLQQAQLLSDAKALASSAAREELALKIASLLDARQTKEPNDGSEDEVEEDDEDSKMEVEEVATSTTGKRTAEQAALDTTGSALLRVH